MNRYLLAAFAVATVVAACSSTTETTSSPGSSSGGSSGASACTPNNTDGASACRAEDVCPGGQYCSSLSCKTGCLTTANCPKGLFCDMAASTTDPFVDNKPVGICRACPTGGGSSSSGGGGASSSSTSGTVEPGSCSDVSGVYTMKADGGSTEGCGEAPDECTVTQTDCKIKLSCPGFYAGSSIDLDDKNKGSFEETITFGGNTVTSNCDVSFPSGKMALDCQFTSPGGPGAAICKYDGTPK